MSPLDFPGRDKLVQCIDDGVMQGDTQAITDYLRRGLCELIQDDTVRLPDCVFETIDGHYGRRELYVSEEHGYSVVAMTWAPGQGTPIHDHSGMWCVEGVWSGELEICQYELVDQKDDQFHFRSVGAMQAGVGSAGSLIPPHEYHTICNPSADQTAVSLHIYRGSMTCCSTFQPLGDNWFKRGKMQLSLDVAV